MYKVICIHKLHMHHDHLAPKTVFGKHPRSCSGLCCTSRWMWEQPHLQPTGADRQKSWDSCCCHGVQTCFLGEFLEFPKAAGPGPTAAEALAEHRPHPTRRMAKRNNCPSLPSRGRPPDVLGLLLPRGPDLLPWGIPGIPQGSRSGPH